MCFHQFSEDPVLCGQKSIFKVNISLDTLVDYNSLLVFVHVNCVQGGDIEPEAMIRRVA